MISNNNQYIALTLWLTVGLPGIVFLTNQLDEKITKLQKDISLASADVSKVGILKKKVVFLFGEHHTSRRQLIVKHIPRELTKLLPVIYIVSRAFMSSYPSIPMFAAAISVGLCLCVK